MAKNKPKPQTVSDPVVPETPPEVEELTLPHSPVPEGTPDEPVKVQEPQVLPEVPNTIEGEPPMQAVRRTGTEASEAVKKAPAKPEDFEFNFDCGKLNRDVLYRIIYALVLGQTHSYVGQGAVRRIGELFGAETHQEAIEIWRKIKRHHTKGN